MNGRNKVSDEAMKLIMENAAWESMGIKVTKPAGKVDEAKAEVKTEPVKPIVENTETVEKHVCPLCESELKAAISDERLIEHTKQMVEVLTEAEDAQGEDEEVDEDEDEDFEDEDLEDVEVDDEEEVEEEE